MVEHLNRTQQDPGGRESEASGGRPRQSGRWQEKGLQGVWIWASPGKTGFGCAEKGKEGQEGSRTQGTVHEGPLTVKHGRLPCNTLPRALQKRRPLVLKATP